MNNNQRKTNDKVREATIVRGVASSLQAMAMPGFRHLNNILKPFGYSLKKHNNKSEEYKNLTNDKSW